jgi:hypothetical protein
MVKHYKLAIQVSFISLWHLELTKFLACSIFPFIVYKFKLRGLFLFYTYDNNPKYIPLQNKG